MSARQMAVEAGVSKSRVVRYLRRAREELAPSRAAALVEHAGEAVASALDAMSLLARNLDDLSRLREACLRELAGEEEGSIDVGPRDADIEVLVPSEHGPPVRRRLAEILRETDTLVFSAGGTWADPRKLLLSTMAEIRQQIEAGLKLRERLHAVRELELFQADVLEVISNVDSFVAEQIRERLQERRALRLALGADGQ